MKASISTGAIALALLLSGCGGESGNQSGTSGGTTTATVPAPNGGDWTQTVAQTPDGGFMMGNPNAPVKLVEFASMTCPHCAEFSKESHELVDKYVKTGQVSYELRNYVRDPADLAATLLARCGGPTPYFQLTDQLFAAQNDWFSKLQLMSQAEQQAMQTMQPAQVVSTIGEKAGLVQFVQMRGIPAEKARQCLSNQAEIQRMVDMANKANQFQIPGTPAFLINGKLVDNAASWDALEPRLKEAIGG